MLQLAGQRNSFAKRGESRGTGLPTSSSTANLIEEEQNQKTFSSSAAIVFSCLGCVVGTGNVWRFPRILAQNSAHEGGLAFIIVWILFLVLWSIPMIIVEYAAGRYSKSSPVKAFNKFMGHKGIWCGGWVTFVTFFITCYYSVVLGWCLYYVVIAMINPLPELETDSERLFKVFTTESYWPLLTHGIAVLVTGSCVIGGVSWIEKANMVLVPLLLVIILFTFCWSLTHKFADYGITYLFSPSWKSLTNPNLWTDAISQNAYDTGAGLGVFIPYAAYMTRKNGIVRFSSIIPLCNNVVSLICAITIFSTVFSTLINDSGLISRTAIVEIMKDSGPGSTGLTFIWIPILFAKFGIFGRVLCVLFFFCLSCAGISSMMSGVEMCSQTVEDFGVPRKFATPGVTIVMFAIGLGSALEMKFLTNQDRTWGLALMISGLCFQLLVIVYGALQFRSKIVNKYGTNDWPLPIVWVILVMVICPLEALAILAWWSYTSITSEPGWFIPGFDSFITVLIEWLILLVILIIINVLLVKTKLRPKWVDEKLDKQNATDSVYNDNMAFSMTTNTSKPDLTIL